VTNTGNVPLTGVAVTDDQGVTVTCPPGALAPGAVKTCTATGTGVLGQYENLGSVTATGAGTTVTDSDPSHYFGVAAGIDIEKATNGADADLAPGPYVPVGGTVTWTYVVRNTGNAPLTGVAVTDDVIGPITCPATTLAVGASMTCTATGTAAAGQYENTGSVTGTSPTGPVSDSDVSHYFGEAPAVDIEKLTNLVDADTPPGPNVAVGGRVTWIYRVTNTGNVPLQSWIVTDPKAPFLLCPRIGLIVPGETIGCYSQSTAIEGQYSNTGTVNATSLGGQPVSDSDPSHYFGIRGAIDLVKSTNGEDANEAPGPSITPGDPVNWTYVVTNTGNTTLDDVAVVDLRGVAVSCPATTLAAGASMTCTGTGTAMAGQYSNLAVARGVTPLGDTVRALDPSHYFGEAPGISIVKETNGVDANDPPGPFVAVGGAVRWTYVVTNTGNVQLSGIDVGDDQGVAVSCPATALAPDEAMTCVATGTATEGQYANNATVTTAQGVSDEDPSHYFGADSDIRIKKFTNGRDADRPRGPVVRIGSTVTWTYAVRNPGNVLVKSLRVTDNHGGVHPSFVGGDGDGDGDLDPGEVWTYEATGIARKGQYANVGTVSGLDVLENPLSDTDPSHYFGSWCTDQPGPPSLAVDASKHLSLPRSGVPADITSDECVDIRTELHPLPRFVKNQHLPRLVGTAKARMRHAGTIHLATPFFDDVRPQINSLNFVCLYLDVFATDPAGNTSHVRKFVVLQK
jgi:predicted secreted protein